MPPSDQQQDISLKRQLRFEYKLTIDSIALSPKMHNTIRKRCLLRIVEIHYYKLLHGRQYALRVSAADAKSDWDRPQPSSGTGVVVNVSSFSSAVYGGETISQGCHCRSSSADYCCSPGVLHLKGILAGILRVTCIFSTVCDGCTGAFCWIAFCASAFA